MFTSGAPLTRTGAASGSAARAGGWITPQTRDLNPVYTGKDVSYIYTKQAQRAIETAVIEVDASAVHAPGTDLAPYQPQAVEEYRPRIVMAPDEAAALHLGTHWSAIFMSVLDRLRPDGVARRLYNQADDDAESIQLFMAAQAKSIEE